MYYEINVAFHHQHFFATSDRSITTREKLARVTEAFIQKFPASEGYDLTITYYEKTGRSIPVVDALVKL